MDLVNFVANVIRNVDFSAVLAYMLLNQASSGSKPSTGARGVGGWDLPQESVSGSHHQSGQHFEQFCGKTGIQLTSYSIGYYLGGTEDVY